MSAHSVKGKGLISVLYGPADGDAVPYLRARLVYSWSGRRFVYVLRVVDGQPAYIPAARQPRPRRLRRA